MAIQLTLLGAVVFQVGLTLALLWLLGRRRLPLVMGGRVNREDVAVTRDGWPLDAQLASNAFDNQFQLPVLFYVAVFVALYFEPNWVEAGLAWAFVASRVVHARIHVTSNNVNQRFTAYVTGFALLSLMWLELAVQLVLSFFARY